MQKQYLEIGQLNDVSNQISISFLVKPAAKQENYAAIFDNASKQCGCWFYFFENMYYFTFGNGSKWVFGSKELGVRLSSDKFQLVTITIGSQSKIFADGAKQAETFSIEMPSESQRSMSLGYSNYYFSNHYFDGCISEFKVFKGELSEQEVLQLHLQSQESIGVQDLQQTIQLSLQQKQAELQKAKEKTQELQLEVNEALLKQKEVELQQEREQNQVLKKQNEKLELHIQKLNEKVECIQNESKENASISNIQSLLEKTFQKFEVRMSDQLQLLQQQNEETHSQLISMQAQIKVSNEVVTRLLQQLGGNQ